MVCTLAAQEPVKPLPPPIAQVLPPGIRWKVDLPAPAATAPLVVGERVFVSVLPGLVAAYDVKDGRELWRDTLDPDQPVEVDADRIFVAGGEAVRALGASDRTTIWRTPTGTVTAPLLVKDGWVIAASASKLFALRASDGAVIWSRDSAPQRARAAISGDLLLVPLASGWIRAHDLTTGEVRWDLRIAGAPAEPLVVGDRLYLGATDKRFYSINIGNGEIDWQMRVGAIVRGTASTDGERVFFAGLDNLVRAVSRGSGSQRWQQGVPFRPFDGPRVNGSVVIVAGPTTDVRLLNTRDGREAGKITFPEPLALAPAFAISADTLVAAGITGGLSEAWTLWLASPQMAAAAK